MYKSMLDNNRKIFLIKTKGNTIITWNKNKEYQELVLCIKNI